MYQQNLRYDKIVEAMGGYGEFVEAPDQVKPALERAFASGKPACVNVIVDEDAPFFGTWGKWEQENYPKSVARRSAQIPAKY